MNEDAKYANEYIPHRSQTSRRMIHSWNIRSRECLIAESLTQGCCRRDLNLNQPIRRQMKKKGKLTTSGVKSRGERGRRAAVPSMGFVTRILLGIGGRIVSVLTLTS